MSVESLFPSDVVVRAVKAGERDDLVLDVERTVVQQAVEKRRAEFAAGRAAARLALEEMDITDFPLLPNPDRSPDWPVGVVGSIAHTEGYAIVAVSGASRYRGIGVDVEPDRPIEPRLWRRLLTADEQADLAALPEVERGRRVRRIFSAKESFHKCIHPGTGVFCDFTDVSLEFAPDDGSFTLRYEPGAPEGGPDPARLRGRWTTDEGRVLTSLVWPVRKEEG